MIDPASLVDVIPFGEIAIDAALVGSATHRIFASSSTLDPHIRDMVQGRSDQHAVQRFNVRHEACP
jgi:sensor c-di-GMP phosphodiesterase-like protein